LHSPQKAQKVQSSPTRHQGYFVTSGLFAAFPFLTTLKRAAFTILLIVLMLPAPAFAQKKDRPKLLPMSRKDFAGKVVLIPRDARILELRMLGQIADHYLVLPPSRMLDPNPQAGPLVEWVTSQNFKGATGAVLALESLAGSGTVEEIQQRLQAIKQIRTQYPKLPIYGFASFDSSNENSKQICQAAIELVAANALDYLLIGQDEDLTQKPPQIARARLIGEVATRELKDRIAIDDDPEVGASTLLSRLLAHRFGWAPKILPVYSSSEGSKSRESRTTLPLDQSIVAKILLSGSSTLTQNSEDAPKVDMLLYVHTPQTTEEQRTAFAMSILQTTDRGARVAVVDLSETRQSKEALLAELRRHKLLGKIISYASSAPEGDPSDEPTCEAASRALAQATIFSVAMKSLRDDIDRVHRIDRAQINLLFTRFIRDWAYALNVYPQLNQFAKEQLQANPDELGNAADRAVKFTFEALKPMADELFNEQFRRNLHAILMNSGTRAQFRVSLLQRLQIRFPLETTSKAEIRQMIHTFYEGPLEITK